MYSGGVSVDEGNPDTQLKASDQPIDYQALYAAAAAANNAAASSAPTIQQLLQGGVSNTSAPTQGQTQSAGATGTPGTQTQKVGARHLHSSRR